MDKDQVIEISQVANGFIVRRSPGNWFHEEQKHMWAGITADYYVFQSLAELIAFLVDHFSHRGQAILIDKK